MKIPCSVPILTLNSKKSLERMLPALVPEIEDVYIMDGNSTDDTQEYARSMGVRIEKQFDNDLSNQRITDFTAMRFRLWSKSKFDWLFLLDADEIPTPELFVKVREIVEKDDPMEVHRFRRVVQLEDGRIVKHAFFYPDLYIRLFNKKSGATLAKRKVHERFVVPEGVKEIDHEEALIAPWPPVGVVWKKMKKYIAMEDDLVPTWLYLWRWIIFYNVRSSFGQLLRAIRCSFRGWICRETVLPWKYTAIMIAYRYVSMWNGVKAWIKQKERVTSNE